MALSKESTFQEGDIVFVSYFGKMPLRFALISSPKIWRAISRIENFISSLIVDKSADGYNEKPLIMSQVCNITGRFVYKMV